MRTVIKFLLIAALVHCALPVSFAAEPQYPMRPIRVIVGFPPGGPTDVIARFVGQKMTESWGQQVVVDNRVGAGGNVGMGLAANAAPDGYTVLFVSSSLMVNPGLYKKVPYDVYRSFIPISVLAASTHVWFSHPSVPAKSISDLINLAKKDKNMSSVATPGVGTVPHLSVHLLAMDSRTNLVTVPYAGGGPSIVAVLGNQVPFGCQAIPPVTPHIQAGRVRALALTSLKRSALLPAVPTMDELGYKGHDAETITGMLVPAGTPGPIVKKLYAEAIRIMVLPDIKQRVNDMGADVIANTPQQFTAQIKREATRWAKVVKDANIPAN